MRGETPFLPFLTITFDVSDGTSVGGSVDATAEALRIALSDSTGNYKTLRDTTSITGDFEAENAAPFLPFPSGSPEAPTP